MKVGEIIDNKYEIIADIDSGGMGTVLKVLDVSSKMELALKYCHESDDGAIRRFGREVRIMTETIHPNIISILDSNLSSTPPYFLMPLASCSVAKIIPNIKGDASKIFSIFDEVCKGISAMHNAGHYHRDIKPSNILLLKNGEVVVSDFGLSKKVIKDSSSHASSNNFIGTYGYHAPEQFEAKTSDERTDVFQLGKTLYEIFTGDYPYLINPSKITPVLNYIIQKATAPEPDDRYQSISELQQALKSYQLSLDPNANPIDAFENRLNEVKNLLNKGHYEDSSCLALLETLSLVKDDPNTFIEFFDKIPDQILKVLSNQLSSNFEDILKVYKKNLEIYFQNNSVNFSYAEEVASKMSAIFDSTSRTDFKVLALYNTMTSAIKCNRFNAMDTFDYLLQSVKSNEDAIAVSDLLKKEIDWYLPLHDRIPKNKLHFLLQPVWDEAEKLVKEEKEKKVRQRQEWIAAFQQNE